MNETAWNPKHPSENDILRLLAAAGIEAEVVYQGPEGGCPTCLTIVERAA